MISTLLRPIAVITLFTVFPASLAVAAARPPIVHFHQMPCIRAAVPDILAISWQVDALDPSDAHGAGHATIRRGDIAASMYRDICSSTLVSVKYGGTSVCACSAAFGSGVYHLAFLRGRTPLLRVTERALGNVELSIDGRPDLGSDTLSCLILPPGVPTTPNVGAVRPGHWRCLHP